MKKPQLRYLVLVGVSIYSPLLFSSQTAVSVAKLVSIKACLPLITKVADRLAIKGNEIPQKPSVFERRLRNYGGPHLLKSLYQSVVEKFYPELKNWQNPIKPLSDDPRLANVSPETLAQVENNFLALGGEIRMTLPVGEGVSIASFLVQDGKPILFLPFYVWDQSLQHELKHFEDWLEAKNDLIAKGHRKKKAAQLAYTNLSSLSGITKLEAGAKAVELSALKNELTKAIETEGLVTRTNQMGSAKIPVDAVFQSEHLIYHMAYPYTELLRRIYDYRKSSFDSRWKFLSRSWTREQFRQSLDEMAKDSFRDLGQMVSSLKKELSEIEARLQKEALQRGDSAAAHDHALVRQRILAASPTNLILLGDLQDQSKRFSDEFKAYEQFIRNGLATEMYQSVATTRISEESQKKIIEYLKLGRSPATHERYSERHMKINHGIALLDLDSLGFTKTPNSQERFDFYDMNPNSMPPPTVLSGTRIFSHLKEPEVDPNEIRGRQQVIAEIMDTQKSLGSQLREVFPIDGNRFLHARFFQDRAPDLDNLFGQCQECWNFKKILTNGLSKANQDYKVAQILSVNTSIQAFFTDVMALRLALKDAQTPRLKQIKWIFDSVVDLEHPLSIANEVRDILDPHSPIKSLGGFDQLRSDKSETLKLVQEAFGELTMYVDIANNAQRFGWKTFPEILDNNKDSGPQITIKDFHNPRVQAIRPKTSVPNSVSIGDKIGRHVIVMGPNAEGKSTFIRSIAQEITLAQLGSPVPAASAKQTPLSIIAYAHPKSDRPADDLSHFMQEGKSLMEQVYKRVEADPFTIVFMDEILPGTISEIREDAEIEFLYALEKLGATTVTATHNWGTAKLAELEPDKFQIFHVDRYHVKKGPISSLPRMYDAALAALKKVGWPDEILDRIKARGEARMRQSVE